MAPQTDNEGTFYEFMTVGKFTLNLGIFLGFFSYEEAYTRPFPTVESFGIWICRSTARNTPSETLASRPDIAIFECAQDRVSSAPLAEAITATLFAGRVCVPRARYGLLSRGCVLEPLPVVAPAPQAPEMGPERPEAYGRRHSAMETLSDRVPRAPNPTPNNPATPFIYLEFEMATIHPVCSP